MKLRENAKYNLVVLTSMGLRLTPQGNQPCYAQTQYTLHATSAETNAATISSSLGCNVLALTSFVKGSPMSELIKRDLRARNISFMGRELEQGGAWGLRHQFNIADSGSGVRGPVVFNDRAGEVGREISPRHFDLRQLFEVDGVQVLHLSGLIASLSKSTGAACLEAARIAKQNGTLVSFDLNYRASFWKGRELELRELFTSIAENVDIIAGNEEDFQLCLGISGPSTGGRGIEGNISGFKEMIKAVGERFKNIKLFATSLREVLSANSHKWGAIAYKNGEWAEMPMKQISVQDRIGGGDGFVGGIIYGVLKEWEINKTLMFAWGCGAIAVTFTTDYALLQSEEQVFSVCVGDARVKR